MYKVSIKPHWRIAYNKGPALDTAMLLRLLSSIKSKFSISQAAKGLNISYRHAWGLLSKAEADFGMPLLSKKRGEGTQLTQFAKKLLEADQRIIARLTPVLDSLSSELETEIAKAVLGQNRTIRLCASHGFAISTLTDHIKLLDLPVELRYQSSTESLATLAQGDCEIAGFHLPISVESTALKRKYLRYLSPKEHVLMPLANLRQGLIIAKGNPKRILSFQDLIRNDVRFVNRQPNSSTRQVFESLLNKNKIDSSRINGFETTEFTHAAVAAYIASNMADVGFGVETASKQFKLDFVSLVEERYFFAFTRDTLENNTMKEIVSIMRSEQFLSEINQLEGYKATGTGALLSVEEVFGPANAL